MVFDFTINIGTVIQLFAILGAGTMVIMRIQTQLALLVQEKRLEHVTNVQRFDNIDGRFNTLDKELELLTKVVVDLAKQDERIKAIENRISDLMSKIDGPIPISNRRRKI